MKLRLKRIAIKNPDYRVGDKVVVVSNSAEKIKHYLEIGEIGEVIKVYLPNSHNNYHYNCYLYEVQVGIQHQTVMNEHINPSVFK